MAEVTFPDRDKNQIQVSQLSDEQLRYWDGRLRGDLDKDPDGKWAGNNRAKLEAVIAEIERRAAGGQRQEPPPRAETASRPASTPGAAPKTAMTLGASIASGGNLMATLERLSESAILVAPTVACESLPEGCEVAISMVKVDTKSKDVYPISFRGKDAPPRPDDELGLSGSLLFRIAASAGVTWLRDATTRADDGKNPYRVYYRTWARVMDIDGSLRDYPGECDCDLSDGGAQAIEIVDKAKKRDRDPEKQLAEARKFIQRSTLTKAMDSAIRKALGLRHSYPREELERKPFAVAKLLFTGHTDDPDYKQLFAQIIASRFGSGERQLYGATAARPARRPIVTTGVPVDPFGPDGAPVDEDQVPY
jgi:hypothetical protein